MTDEPTAAPTRPTRELWDRVRMTAANAVLAGEWYGPVDAASERIADAVTPLLADEGTAQPDPSRGAAQALIAAWDAHQEALMLCDQSGAVADTLLARETALETLRAALASGEGTAPQPGTALDALVSELREAVAAYEGKAVGGPDGWQDPHDAEQYLAGSVDRLLDEIDRLRDTANRANASARRRGEERDALRAMVDGCREIVAEHEGKVDGDRPIDDIAAVVGYPERGTAPQVPAEVLWEGPAGQLAAALLGKKPSERGWDPNAVVRVVAADGAPQEASDG